MAEPSFLRRLRTAHINLRGLWRRAQDAASEYYEAVYCTRVSMMREPLRSRDSGSIFPRFNVDAPMPAPPNPPSGGTSASKAVYRREPVPACTIAPSLDSLHLAFEEPLIGYLSKTGYRLFREEPDWHTKLCRDQAELNAKGGVVEVEIRVRRVVER